MLLLDSLGFLREMSIFVILETLHHFQSCMLSWDCCKAYSSIEFIFHSNLLGCFLQLGLKLLDLQMVQVQTQMGACFWACAFISLVCGAFTAFSSFSSFLTLFIPLLPPRSSFPFSISFSKCFIFFWLLFVCSLSSMISFSLVFFTSFAIAV